MGVVRSCVLYLNLFYKKQVTAGSETKTGMGGHTPACLFSGYKNIIIFLAIIINNKSNT